MSRLIDIDDERFWDVLFDEACVEGNQAERIKNELEKIVAFDTEKVVEQLEKAKDNHVPTINGKTKMRDLEVYKMTMGYAIDIVKKGGVE